MFKNRDDLILYANKFVKRRIKTFRKDISICLTADENHSHAYMPALLTCISLLELFSGLYAGKLKRIGIDGILSYSKRFLKTNTYTCDRLSVLYEMFRHKIAHVTQPYGVFDTYSVYSKHPLKQFPKRLITWKVNASDRHPPIDIVSKAGTLTEQPPWHVRYTHKCMVSIHRLNIDICKSATGKGGYLEELKKEEGVQNRFEKCMIEF